MRAAAALLFAVPALAAKKNVMQLDTFSFDKVVGGSSPVLLKFDKEYPYGDKEDAWKAFAEKEEVIGADLIVAEVGVQDYGDDKYNEKLRDRFGVKNDDFPVLKLFLKGTKDAITFTGDVKADAITQFVKEKAGVWLGLPGTLQVFDELADKFVASVEGQDAVLADAEKELAKLSSAKDKDAAQYYIQVMKKMKGKGAIDDCKACERCFPEAEARRMAKLKQGKLSDTKKSEFDRKLNALPSFKLKSA